MNIRKRIQKLESTLTPETDREAWFTKHKPEIESRMDALWKAVGPDLIQFIGWVKDGSYLPFGRYPDNGKRFTFWVPRNKADNPEPVGSCQIATEVDYAMREFFEPPDGDPELHQAEGEAYPLTQADTIAFIESHLETIAGWMTLKRFQDSEFFKTFGGTQNATGNRN